jgi:hypothetical protein
MTEKYRRRGAQDALARTAGLIEKLEELVGKVSSRKRVVMAPIPAELTGPEDENED